MYPFFFFHSSKERPTAGCPKVGACNTPALYNICSNNIYITYPLEQSARSLEGPISVLFCVHLPESHSHGSEKKEKKEQDLPTVNFQAALSGHMCTQVAFVL